MAKMFIDTNVFIDFIEKRKNIDVKLLADNSLYISPLSIHILSYTYKYKLPEKKLNNINEIISIIPFDKFITAKALTGPSADFEDNVQLHSAAEAECDVFLTSDKKLLDMKFFGKTQIISPQDLG